MRTGESESGKGEKGIEKTLLSDDKSVFVAYLEGFEPPTYWFVARHSIQLS